MDTKNIQPDEAYIFALPDGIRSIERVLDRLEQAQREFRKAAESLAPKQEAEQDDE